MLCSLRVCVNMIFWGVFMFPIGFPSFEVKHVKNPMLIASKELLWRSERKAWKVQKFCHELNVPVLLKWSYLPAPTSDWDMWYINGKRTQSATNMSLIAKARIERFRGQIGAASGWTKQSLPDSLGRNLTRPIDLVLIGQNRKPAESPERP